jgi:hypothetical protein
MEANVGKGVIAKEVVAKPRIECGPRLNSDFDILIFPEA